MPDYILYKTIVRCWTRCPKRHDSQKQKSKPDRILCPACFREGQPRSGCIKQGPAVQVKFKLQKRDIYSAIVEMWTDLSGIFTDSSQWSEFPSKTSITNTFQEVFFQNIRRYIYCCFSMVSRISLSSSEVGFNFLFVKEDFICQNGEARLACKAVVNIV